MDSLVERAPRPPSQAVRGICTPLLFTVLDTVCRGNGQERSAGFAGTLGLPSSGRRSENLPVFLFALQSKAAGHR